MSCSSERRVTKQYRISNTDRSPVIKTIDTLVTDIYKVLQDGLPEEYDEGRIQAFGETLGRIVASRIDGGRSHVPALRMSNIGSPCERKLWYSINASEQREELPPATRMKFLFGDILEALLLFLAEAAGHTVEGTQDTQEIEGVKGHRDAVIDGVVVDAKSASTYSFKKFEDGSLEGNDPFGYVDQLQSYLYAGQSDDKVTDKDRAAFLVVDKTLGNICLDIHKRKDFPYDALYRYKKEVVNSPEVPERGFEPEADGVSGNLALGTNCGYCDWKHVCYPNLRTFLYSGKPRFLTKVVREPKVPEVK